MCRSIKKLRDPNQPPTDEEVSAAARQFVREVSGYRTPSQANRVAFEQAIAEIATATQRLLASISNQTTHPTP